MADPAEPPIDEPAPGRRRGTPKGQATILGVGDGGGGAIGNPPFQPTDEQRAKVRTYAKVFPRHGEHYIARLVGVSRTTLRKYFEDDLLLGRAEMLASVGSQMINRAIDANSESVKGDLEAQKYILARMGGWTTKVETGDKAGLLFGGDGPDLSRFSDEELALYGKLCEAHEGLESDEIDDGDYD